MDLELEELPHVIMACNVDWSHSRYNSTPPSDDMWFKQQAEPDALHQGFNFAVEHVDASLDESLTPSILSVLLRQGP